ncbi:MAG TPA: alpha/beta hydrolase-fold protein [Rugosimonospora sp.]|nr:alpha/beta hydrolase-fold protein [Rugosimonospora sp.]
MRVPGGSVRQHRSAGGSGWRRARATGAAVVLVAVFGTGYAFVERDHMVHAARPLLTPAPGDPASSPAAPSPSPTCPAGTDSIVSAPDPGAPDDRRQVWVHRPPGPDSASIPVLYLLHGYPGDPTELADSDLPQLLDAQMCRTGRPFVIAMPDGRSDDVDTEWGDDTSGRFDIETFVTTVAVRLVEGHHKRPATLRAIGGFSMGGYGAAVLALRHPREYRQVAAFGGYYHVDDPDGVFGSDPSPHAPDQLVDKADGQRYFLVEGTDENTQLQEGSILGEADRFAALLRAAGVTVSVRHPPGGHSPAAWYLELGAMADFLAVGWPSA